MHRRRCDLALWLVLISVMLSACTLVTPPRHRETQRQLRDQQQRWSVAPLEAYRFTLQVFCFCALQLPDGVTIEVRNGTSTILPASADGLSIEQQQALEQWDTMEDLFGYIQAAIDSDYDEISVAYDPARGYPTQIGLDWMGEAADDERGLTIRNVEIIP